MHQRHPAQDPEEIDATARGRQLDGERPRGQQDREPRRDHPSDQDARAAADRAAGRRVDRIAPDRADQAHVHEVGPERRQPAVGEEQALHDQHGADDHRPRPRAEHDRRERPPHQVARDAHPDGEVDHLRGEDERRHRPHQDRRPVAQPALQPPEPHREPGRRHHGRRRRHPRVEHRVGNVHRRDPGTTSRHVTPILPPQRDPSYRACVDSSKTSYRRPARRSARSRRFAASGGSIQHSDVHWLINQVSTSESIGEVRRWAHG